MGQSYGLSPKLSYLCWRESTQRFSAQSKDCLLDARYLLCVISLVLAGSPPSSHRQLAFVNSIAIMESSALPRRLLEHRVSCNATAGCIPMWRALLEDLNLHSISDLLANQRAHNSWKLAIPSNFSLFIQTYRSAWIVHSFRLVCATFLLGSLPPIGPSPLRIPRRPAVIISAYVSSLVVMVWRRCKSLQAEAERALSQ